MNDLRIMMNEKSSSVFYTLFKGFLKNMKATKRKTNPFRTLNSII